MTVVMDGVATLDRAGAIFTVASVTAIQSFLIHAYQAAEGAAFRKIVKGFGSCKG